MALADLLTDAVDTIMAALDDLPVTIQYYSVVTGSYNPTTDSNGNVETLITCQGIEYRGKETETDYKQTDLDDSNVLIGRNQFGATVPKKTDYLVIAGVKKEIRQIKKIPGNPAYIFNVRTV